MLKGLVCSRPYSIVGRLVWCDAEGLQIAAVLYITKDPFSRRPLIYRYTPVLISAQDFSFP